MIMHDLTPLNRHCKDVVIMHLKKLKEGLFFFASWRGVAGAGARFLPHRAPPNPQYATELVHWMVSCKKNLRTYVHGRLYFLRKKPIKSISCDCVECTKRLSFQSEPFINSVAVASSIIPKYSSRFHLLTKH
jgi:hypothetical protein